MPQPQDTPAPLCAQVPLFNRRGEVLEHALVDVDDLARVTGHRWHLRHGKYKYALNAESYAMHRVILGLVKGNGLEVDHINRNGLDNRRANLRVVSRATNAKNRGANRGRRYCGVSYDKQKGRWRARIRMDHKRHHIGWFDTEDEAGRAAEAWSRVHLPERWLVP